MKNILITTSFVLNLISAQAFATSWPIFSYPDKELLLKLNFLTKEGCSSNEVKLKTNSTVNISQYNCQGYCPEEWTWISTSDESCHKLDEIIFKGYEITHIPDDPYWEYSVVTASFGAINSDNAYYQFTMKTIPDANFPWYCTLFKPGLDLITCANDFFNRGI